MVRPADTGPVGVVLVHGIGRQRAFDARRKFSKALQRAYGDLKVRDEGAALEIALPGGTLRLYEAYWAELLTGEAVRDTFDDRDTHMVGWFPWLNLRGGLYRSGWQRRRRVQLRVALWTCLFLPLALSIQLLLGLAYAVASAVQRGPQFRALLDEVPGDVFNYVTSAAGAGPPESSLRAVADQIEARLVDALDAAKAEGCSKIVVVAHSLGTVIAARVLFGNGTLPPVQCLHTIGSPLGKVRFIWPLLVPEPPPDRLGGLMWHNFSDPLDVISSRLGTAPGSPHVHNHCLLGRAGLGSAHVTYEDHPRFMEEFARSLGHKPPKHRRELVIRARLAIRSVLETLALFGVVIVALLTGLLGCVLIAGMTAAIASLPSGSDPPAVVHYALGHFWVAVLVIGAIYFIIVFVALPVTRGRYLARLRHYAHRCQRQPPPPQPVDKYQISAPKCARGEDRGWKRAAPVIALVVLLVLGGAVALWFELPVSRAQQVPVSLGYGHISRTLAAVVRPLVALVGSVSLFFMILFVLASVVNVWEGAVNGLRRYRSYIRRTTLPPVD
jgi:hypothetical protein